METKTIKTWVCADELQHLYEKHFLWPNDLVMFFAWKFWIFVVFLTVFIIKDTFITFCQHSGKMHFLPFVNILNKNALMLSNSVTKKFFCIFFFGVNLIVFIKILWLISANWWFLYIWIPYWLLGGLIYPDLCLMIFVILWFELLRYVIRNLLQSYNTVWGILWPEGALPSFSTWAFYSDLGMAKMYNRISKQVFHSESCFRIIFKNYRFYKKFLSKHLL